MRSLTTLCAVLALALAGCQEDQTGTVAEVLTCTDSASRGVSPKCRVVLEDGTRVTVRAPVEVGDPVVDTCPGGRMVGLWCVEWRSGR